MDAGKVQINDIFKNNTALRVPYFQRPYVWDTDEWRRFVKDLEHVAETKQSYFLGSVILKKEPNVTIPGAGQQFGIVDGQQRLTTIILFMRALLRVMGDTDDFRNSYIVKDMSIPSSQRSEPILRHNTHDHPIFREICNADTEAGISSKKENIARAYTYFSNYLNRRSEDAEDNMPTSCLLNDLYDAITNHVFLVRITLDADDNEQQIFDTINAAGVRLTTGELLKNFFFNEDNQNLYNIWSDAFDKTDPVYKFWEGSMTSGRNSDNNTEAFFYAFMQIKMLDKTLGVKDIHKKIFRHRDNGMFNNYKQLMKQYHIDPNTMIQEIVEYANTYKDCFDIDILDKAVTARPSVERLNCFMRASNTWTPIPYILYVKHNVADVEEQEKIWAYLENYLLRRYINKSKNGNYSDFFSENLIGQGINTYDALRNYVEVKNNEDSLAMPTDEMIRQAVCEKNLSNKMAKIIFYMLESRKTDLIDFPAFETFAPAYLLPKTASSAWPIADKETREKAFVLLGNWILAQPNKSKKKIPANTLNQVWSLKKNSLRSMLTLTPATSADVMSAPDWEEDNVDVRNINLSELINSVWPVSAAMPSLPVADEEPDDEEKKIEEQLIEEESSRPLVAPTEEDVAYATTLNSIDSTSLPQTSERTFVELASDTALRNKFITTRYALGLTEEEAIECRRSLSYAFDSYLPQKMNRPFYEGLTVFNEIFEFLSNVKANMKSCKYPEAIDNCISYFEFCQREQAGRNISVEDVCLRKKRTFLVLTYPDGNTVKSDSLTILRKVVEYIGARKIATFNVCPKICGDKVVTNKLMAPKGAEDLGDGFWLTTKGQKEDRSKAIRTLILLHHSDLKISK